MSTSPLKYPVTFEAAEMLTSKKPLDAFTARNVALNNLCHYADEAAQARVNWCLPRSVVSGGQGYILPLAGTIIAGFLYSFRSWTFPICLRASGRSYRLRVRIGGSTGGSGNATFYATLTPSEVPLGLSGTTIADDSTWIGTTAGTGAAWLTGASGSATYGNMVELRPDQTVATYRSTPSVDVLAGERRSVAVPTATLTIYGVTDTNGVSPKLYAVYAAEYIGYTAP